MRKNSVYYRRMERKRRRGCVSFDISRRQWTQKHLKWFNVSTNEQKKLGIWNETKRQQQEQRKANFYVLLVCVFRRFVFQVIYPLQAHPKFHNWERVRETIFSLPIKFGSQILAQYVHFRKDWHIQAHMSHYTGIAAHKNKSKKKTNASKKLWQQNIKKRKHIITSKLNHLGWKIAAYALKMCGVTFWLDSPNSNCAVLYFGSMLLFLSWKIMKFLSRYRVDNFFSSSVIFLAFMLMEYIVVDLIALHFYCFKSEMKDVIKKCFPI